MHCTKSPAKCQAYTLSDIAQMDREVLTPEIAGKAIGISPYAISLMARTPEGCKSLGFPVIRIGSRTKIPRVPFLRFMGWEGEIAHTKEAEA